MQHPDEGLIHSWLDGELNGADAGRLEAHAAECAACAARVAEARGLLAGASGILLALDGVPAGVVPRAAAGAEVGAGLRAGAAAEAGARAPGMDAVDAHGAGVLGAGAVGTQLDAARARAARRRGAIVHAMTGSWVRMAASITLLVATGLAVTRAAGNMGMSPGSDADAPRTLALQEADPAGGGTAGGAPQQGGTDAALAGDGRAQHVGPVAPGAAAGSPLATRDEPAVETRSVFESGTAPAQRMREIPVPTAPGAPPRDAITPPSRAAGRQITAADAGGVARIGQGAGAAGSAASSIAGSTVAGAAASARAAARGVAAGGAGMDSGAAVIARDSLARRTERSDAGVVVARVARMDSLAGNVVAGTVQGAVPPAALAIQGKVAGGARGFAAAPPPPPAERVALRLVTPAGTSPASAIPLSGCYTLELLEVPAAGKTAVGGAVAAEIPLPLPAIPVRVELLAQATVQLRTPAGVMLPAQYGSWAPAVAGDSLRITWREADRAVLLRLSASGEVLTGIAEWEGGASARVKATRSECLE